MLRRIYRSDGEINLKDVIHRATSDPIKPVAENGRMRLSTSLVVAGLMALLFVAAFVYFSFGAQK